MDKHERHEQAAAGEPFDWDEMYSGQETDYEPPNPLLLEMVADLPPGRALDVGCGAGGLLVALAQRGWKVTGIDVAPKAIAAATKVIAKHGVEAELHVADAAKWAPTGSYDLVTNNFALPGTRAERLEMFRAVQRALAPGGRVLIEDFDEGMHVHEFLAQFEPLTLEELREGFDELSVLRAEVVVTPKHDHGEHGSDDDEPWTAALFYAERPR